MKAIILAAGQGTRLNIDIPKCLIKVNNQFILDKIVNELRENGIDDIYIVVGYKYKKIKNQLVKYRYNADWYNTDDLCSLIMFKKDLDDDIIVMHSDIIFEKGLLEKIIDNKNNVAAIYLNGKFTGIAKMSKGFVENLSKMKFEAKTRIEDIFNILDEGADINKIEIDRGLYNIDTKKDLEIIKDRFYVTF